MIISKAPLRMSFTGGGSDLPSYYLKNGGAVISTSIDKYIYINVNKKFDNQIRIGYSKTEIVDNVSQIEHTLVKPILEYLNIDGGIEITSIADIPSRGSGLGSSSTFSVALLHALHAYKGEYVPPQKLAEEACMIEIEKCGQPIGKQDQYASAFGGLNFIQFKQDDTISVDPIICFNDTKKRLEDNLIMLYTGITRSASNILEVQNNGMISDEKKQQIMKNMVGLTYDLKKELENNNLNNFGKILHENRILKKELAGGISNEQIDYWYDRAIKAGAHGGKLLGAGGGGFLLFYAPIDKHENICSSLSDLRRVKFKFENDGSKIIFIH